MLVSLVFAFSGLSCLCFHFAFETFLFNHRDGAQGREFINNRII